MYIYYYKSNKERLDKEQTRDNRQEIKTNAYLKKKKKKKRIREEQAS